MSRKIWHILAVVGTANRKVIFDNRLASLALNRETTRAISGS